MITFLWVLLDHEGKGKEGVRQKRFSYIEMFCFRPRFHHILILAIPVISQCLARYLINRSVQPRLFHV